MSCLLAPAPLTASELHALEALRVRFARAVRYPFLSAAELRRLDFLRYCFALHGRPVAPDLAEDTLALGRQVELYLTGYGQRRSR